MLDWIEIKKKTNVYINMHEKRPLEMSLRQVKLNELNTI